MPKTSSNTSKVSWSNLPNLILSVIGLNSSSHAHAGGSGPSASTVPSNQTAAAIPAVQTALASSAAINASFMATANTTTATSTPSASAPFGATQNAVEILLDISYEDLEKIFNSEQLLNVRLPKLDATQFKITINLGPTFDSFDNSPLALAIRAVETVAYRIRLELKNPDHVEADLMIELMKSSAIIYALQRTYLPNDQAHQQKMAALQVRHQNFLRQIVYRIDWILSKAKTGAIFNAELAFRVIKAEELCYWQGVRTLVAELSAEFLKSASTSEFRNGPQIKGSLWPHSKKVREELEAANFEYRLGRVRLDNCECKICKINKYGWFSWHNPHYDFHNEFSDCTLPYRVKSCILLAEALIPHIMGSEVRQEPQIISIITDYILADSHPDRKDANGSEVTKTKEELELRTRKQGENEVAEPGKDRKDATEFEKIVRLGNDKMGKITRYVSYVLKTSGENLRSISHFIGHEKILADILFGRNVPAEVADNPTAASATSIPVNPNSIPKGAHPIVFYANVFYAAQQKASRTVVDQSEATAVSASTASMSSTEGHRGSSRNK